MSSTTNPGINLEPFRAALRFYPSRWRREREDEVLSVLLDVAEAEGRDTPTRAVRIDLAVRGLAERVDAVMPAVARRWASLIALIIGVSLSLHVFFLGEWGPWIDATTQYDQPVGTFGVFTTPYTLICLLWAVIAISSLSGSRIFVRALAVCTVVLSVLMPLLTLITGTWTIPALLLIINACLALTIAATYQPGAALQRFAVLASALVINAVTLYRSAELNWWQTNTYIFYANWGQGYNAVTIAWIGCLAFFTLTLLTTAAIRTKARKPRLHVSAGSR